jgi:60S ribosome subunit biogenesis protein NIP7
MFITSYSIGRNLQLLIERKDGDYVFRIQKDRVYYCSEDVLKVATGIPRAHLVSLGTCIGKFTHTKKFRLHVTALDYLAQFAKYKMWIKPSGEMSYLYGNNVLKAHLGRITMGFGVCARSTQDCRKIESTAIVGFHQADIGEYLRSEEQLT